jgi:hypothetical protein
MPTTPITDPKPPTPNPSNGVDSSRLVYGQISPEVNQQINDMRGSTHQALYEIGRIEVRKSQLVRSIAQMEGQTRALLNSESQVLGIPEGTPWELTPEGVALGPAPGG